METQTDKNLLFKEKAEKIHKNNYDYSLVHYLHSQNKVTIICPTHGNFEQRPNNHLKGEGCKKCCFDKQRKKINVFIEKATMIHNNNYDYSLVEYKNIDTKVKIICPVHGEFVQTPANHLKGSGCLKCSSINRRVGNDDFISKAKKIHNDKYDYSLVDYKTSHVKVKINCSKHGEFKQTPHSHLKGQGCPICNESKGELKIRELLNDKQILFVTQKRFKDCKNIKELPFDFYLSDYNICIEFNGIQHYKPIEAFGGDKAFKEQQKNDKIKRKYCEKNNILLLIIKYNENVNNILVKMKQWVK